MSDVTTLEIPGGVRVVVPNSISLLTPYVLYEQGDWFEDEIGFLRRSLLPGQRAIDIGANYGVYTLSIAATVGQAGSVWAFEPTSTTASFLAQSITANGFQHILLVPCAVSSECGQAQLTLNRNPEENALTRSNSTGGSIETVDVVTLDDCMRRYAWNNIAFLKIDAEGEEANIIAGARQFLATNSPLVMFEIKSGATLHMELINKFADCGYRTYRLVTGLQLLVPFEANEAPDGYLLNLFCCRDDTADGLMKRGLLLSAKSLSAFDASRRLQQFLQDRSRLYQWQQKLTVLPYGAALARQWEAAPASTELTAVGIALMYFAISRDEDVGPLMRYRALEASQRAMQALCERDPQFLRLASLARVSRAFGARSVAVEALGKLCDKIAQAKQVPVGEPFLCASSRFETIQPRDDVGQWALAGILEELERLSSFSSFYHGNAARPRLELIATLGYADAEMNRRLELITSSSGQVNIQENIPELLSGAIAKHQQGHIDAAATMYETILARQRDHFDAMHLSGVVALQRGRFADAQRLIGGAVALNPLQPAALGNLGTSYLRNGQPELALLWFQVALGLQPDSHSAVMNTATALCQCGRYGAAISLLQELTAAIDAPYDAHNLLGQCLFKSGRADKAVEAFEAATLEDADRPEGWANLSVALQAIGDAVGARDAARRARGCQPQLDANTGYTQTEKPGLPMLIAAVNVLLANGLNDEAVILLRRAVSLDVDNLVVRWLLAIAVLKPIYNSDAELQESRRAFSNSLDEIKARRDTSLNLRTAHEAVGAIQPFFLVYHPYCNRELLGRYGALCVAWMAEFVGRGKGAGHALTDVTLRPATDKFRLGIISSHIREHSVWAAITKGWVQALDRGKIDIHIFHLSKTIDEETEQARRTAARFEAGPADLSGWIEVISRSNLDAIIYPEIGMDPLTLKLAALRLAPWQVVSWGHPETSGLPTIDAFLSSEMMDSPHAIENYTERLVRLPNLGVYCEPLSPALNDPDMPALKLTRDEPLLLCPGSPFKYSPIFDDVWVRIAKGLRKKIFGRGPGGRLVFFRSASEILDRALEARLRAAFLAGGVDFDTRVSIVPYLERSRFYGLMSESTLMLDTLGFSGFNTAIQAVEGGLPILTFDGEFLRGRLASGVMRMLDLPELIAATKEEFIERALELVAAPRQLQELRQKIVERRSRLFRDVMPVRALEKYLLEEVPRIRGGSPKERSHPGPFM